MTQVTVQQIRSAKRRGKKLVMLTAYDYPMAKAIDEAGVDLVLVGDSLAMVVLGFETTAPVSVEEMLHHAKAARRGVSRALLIGDMPLAAFGSTPSTAVRNAKRFLVEAGCDAVKIEWKPSMDQTARAMVDAGMAVMGHVGLTPQTAAAEGGFGMRGKDAASAARIIAQAEALERAGCFAMVLECVPDEVARQITKRLKIPTIGIGSGPHCDGQVVVTYDLLGLFDRFTPKFVKQYAHLGDVIRQATSAFVGDVRAGRFPGKEQTRTMAPDEFKKLKQRLS
ncbi:MAG: 3-methyl-2-oxobutanoate hydroxymethyltransferase [Candidatus Omnitrophica bacterium]|nr:3-methyl-2-oxobutanoate hydroxymethyltransferase [Candidatus Omnitrophota bacterium]